MRQNLISGTSLCVSRWSLGTGSLHHVYSARQRLRLLDYAADVGFSHFDTSPLYGSGLAERDLGKFLRHRRQSVTIATKVGLYPIGDSVHSATTLWLRRGWLRVVRTGAIATEDWRVCMAERSLDDSLARLATDHVDVLFLHEPNPERIVADEFLRWIEHEVARGRVGTFGLAGAKVASLSWVASAHPLARVLQIKDSLDRREADQLAAAGRMPQFTYGYFSSQESGPARVGTSARLQEILDRNRSGSIIVSTRRPERLADFAKAAEAERCA